MLCSQPTFAAPTPELFAPRSAILADSLSRPVADDAPVISVQLCYGEFFQGQYFYTDTLFSAPTLTPEGVEQHQLFDIRVAFSGDDSYVAGPTILCEEGPAELRVSRPFSSFNWDDGSSGRSRTVPGPGTYHVTITDVNGCTKEMSHTLAVSSVRIASADAVRPRCPGGESGSLSVAAQGNGPLMYALDGDGGYQRAGRFESLRAGTYTVRVENPEGCTAQRSVTVPAASPLHLFDPNHRSGMAHPGQRLRLPTAPNFTPEAVRWITETPLDCDGCLAPVVDEAEQETFVVEAKSPAGCAVRDTFSLAVSPERVVFAPGAFTPNADGQNDRWRLYAAGDVKSIGDLNISDMDGKILHRQSRALPPGDDQLRWDGTTQGKTAETGTYRYAATLNLSDGTQRRINGTLQLIR